MGLLIKELLKDVNSRLRKRMRSFKSHKRSKLKLRIQNTKMVQKDWDECLKNVEKKKTFNYRFTEEDFIKTRSYFEWISIKGHEYCKVDDLMNHLKKESKDKIYIQ